MSCQEMASELKNEISQQLLQLNVSNFSMASVKRNYASERANVPAGEQYVMKINYPFKVKQAFRFKKWLGWKIMPRERGQIWVWFGACERLFGLCWFPFVSYLGWSSSLLEDQLSFEYAQGRCLFLLELLGFLNLFNVSVM